MKVLLLPADASGCRYYRMEEPARAIREMGVNIEISVQTHLDVDGERRGGETILRSVDAGGADVVVFQRPTNMMMHDAMRLLQKKGVACVVEVDDLLHAVSRGHAGHETIIQEKAANRVMAMARDADLVTVSSESLLREYARHGRGRLIPNAIPRRITELRPAYERDPSVVMIGWTGSVGTHPHDLQTVGSGLRTALDRLGDRAEFAILGQATGAKERLSLDHDPIEFPWVNSVDTYLEMIGDKFDVGLAPLRDDRFNQAKSYLKPMEYAARGVFPIRSRVLEYDHLGIGWGVKSPKDWALAIAYMVNNHDYRREMAVAARDTVVARHLTEHTAELWLSAWKQALDNRVSSNK